MSENSTHSQVSRRGFLGASLAAPFTMASVESVALTPHATAQSDDAYLHFAQETARWIRSARIDRPDRAPWVPEPDRPDKPVTVGPDNTIYSGSAGIVLFFIGVGPSDWGRVLS